MQWEVNNCKPICADLKKTFTSVNNFIVINSLCNLINLLWAEFFVKYKKIYATKDQQL